MASRWAENEGTTHMRYRLPLVLAALAATAVPATIAISQTSPPAERRVGASDDVRARMLEGRLAMAKTALQLSSEQLQLWGPVEQHIRASVDERNRARQERRQARQSGTPRTRLSLPDRLDRASARMAKRAERMKAFSAVFKPFYSSLNDEQKAVAGIVMRQMRGDGMPGHGHRFAGRRAPSSESQKQ
jgi:hypothetical protein